MSGLPFTKAHLLELEKFVALIKADPQILYNPELKFFKNFVESLGGTLPPLNKPNVGGDAPGVGPTKTAKKPEPEPNPEVESEESDIELDVSGVVEPDIEEPQAMGDSDKEVSEEDIDISNAKKREAISAYSDGDYEKAIQIYTEAILLNPASALLYAKRGQAYLQLNKPNACIRDCSRALQINPDSAAAYKFRGRAHRLLGHWEEAAKDLRESCKLDFDEQADEWLREVTPNARKLEDHHRKYERKHAEKELKEKVERARRAREEHARAAKESSEDLGGDSGDPGDFYKTLFSDPELMQAFQDPEVAAAFQDITSNPANMAKYQGNPKIKAVINKLAAKFGGAGGMPGGFGGMPGGFGGMPGGFGGMGGGFPGYPPTGGSNSTPGSDDVGLD